MALPIEDTSIVSESVPECAPSPPVVGSMPLNRPRPVIGGKFLVSDRKLYIRGVTYGAFRPDPDGN